MSDGFIQRLQHLIRRRFSISTVQDQCLLLVKCRAFDDLFDPFQRESQLSEEQDLLQHFQILSE